MNKKLYSMSSLLETHEEYIENKERFSNCVPGLLPQSHSLSLGRLWTDVNFAQAVIQNEIHFLGGCSK